MSSKTEAVAGASKPEAVVAGASKTDAIKVDSVTSSAPKTEALETGSPAGEAPKSQARIAGQRTEAKPENTKAAEPRPGDTTEPQQQPVSKSSERPKKGLLGSYKDEVAELLGGAKARRKRNVTASGLPAPDPDNQEPPIKLTRPPRRGRAQDKD